METTLFRKFCDLAYENAGIRLGEGKEALVSARLSKLLRTLGLATHRDYYDRLVQDTTGEELTRFLDAISTNFTLFLREQDHFGLLAREVKRRVAAGQRSLKFWSAASSSGEEPYSMAVTILDALGGADVDFRILATDISTRVLEQAVRGIYEAEKVEPLSKEQRAKYFFRHKTEGGALYEVKPEVKARILFKRLNLAKPPFPMKGPFDMVFCRNVMIYFDNHVRTGLIREIVRLIEPGSLFVVGHSESLAGIKVDVDTLRPSVYRRSAW